MVGVFKASPIYVMGLARLLSPRGFALETVTEPLTWLRRHQGAPVLVDVQRREDFDIIVELKAEEPDSVVVTLIDKIDLPGFQASLAAGAAGSIARDAEAADVVLAFNAAMSDNIVIPGPVARAFVADNGGETKGGLDTEQIDWLRSLATGDTVVELARGAAYSEREMYRRLRRTYNRIGASGGTDALMKAARLGWLE